MLTHQQTSLHNLPLPLMFSLFCSLHLAGYPAPRVMHSSGSRVFSHTLQPQRCPCCSLPVSYHAPFLLHKKPSFEAHASIYMPTAPACWSHLPTLRSPTSFFEDFSFCIIAVLSSSTPDIILGDFKVHKINSFILLTLSFLSPLHDPVQNLSFITCNCNVFIVSRSTILFFDYHPFFLPFISSQYFNIFSLIIDAQTFLLFFFLSLSWPHFLNQLNGLTLHYVTGLQHVFPLSLHYLCLLS